MSAFYIRYPVSGNSTSVGAIGQPAPGDATLVAGVGPDGNLHALSTDNSGVLNVNAALAPGGTVTANQGLPAILGNAWPVKLTDGIISNTFDPNGLLVSASQKGTWNIANIPNSAVSAGNSTLTPLGVAGVFVGTGVDVTQYSAIIIIFVTDRNGTLVTEYSNDNVNWDYTETYAITLNSPGTPESFTFCVLAEAQYFRVRYVNGGTAQTLFKMQTVLKTNSASGEVHQVSFPVVDRTEAQVTKGVIYGKTTGGGGGYVAVKVSPSGALAVDTGTITVIGNVQSTEVGFTRARAPTRLDYTVTPVTTAAYVQIAASVSAPTREIEIFDSSGQTLVLALGAPGAEVDQIFIFPGGNGRVKFQIPGGTPVSIKAVSGTANVGENTVNYYA